MDVVARFLHERDLRGMRQWLLEAGTLEIAEELRRADPEHRALAFRLVPKDRALAVFEMLEPLLQQELLATLREASTREILEQMEPDDRARLLDELPARLAKQLLEGLSSRERKLTSILLGYPEGSVGRIMSPEFVDIREEMLVSEALGEVRASGRHVEAIYSLPVTTADEKLIDVIDLGDLVLADPTMRVGDLVTGEAYHARASDHQEDASRLLIETGIMALPIIDSDERLVGVLTFDDAMEVLQESDTEQILRTGGSEPLGTPYLSASVLGLTRTRAIWLMFLALAATLTVNVLNHFEEVLQSAIRLSLFIPLLIGIGGNVGAQSATVIVRAIALGEVRFGDFVAVLLREVRVGSLLGSVIGMLAFIPVSVLFGRRIALVLTLSLISIATLAAMVGSSLPMLARRTGIDPAVVSAPIITTLVDTTGLVLYFLIGKAVLGI